MTHIDYDAILDYGKVLPVPETVPYRLTNEFQSAMGFFWKAEFIKYSSICLRVL